MSKLKISGSKCSECLRAIVPPRETCPYCGTSAGPMNRIKLAPRGIVQSHTTLQMPPEGFKSPLLLALVELEYGALILCLSSEEAEKRINIGDRVEIELDSEERFCYRTIT